MSTAPPVSAHVAALRSAQMSSPLATPTPTIHIPVEPRDIEKGNPETHDDQVAIAHAKIDIEHVHVENDPRKWSRRKKVRMRI